MRDMTVKVYTFGELPEKVRERVKQEFAERRSVGEARGGGPEAGAAGVRVEELPRAQGDGRARQHGNCHSCGCPT